MSNARPALPHLHRDRFGTFYFRLTVNGRTLRRSLRTKDRATATMLASKLNWEWAMTPKAGAPSVADIIKAFKSDGREFDAEFSDGTKITGINTDDDLRRAKELMLARIEAIGPVEPHLAPLRPAPQRPQAEVRSAMGKPTRFLAAAKPYLAEMRVDNINTLKTRDAKQSTYDAFAAQFSNPLMAAIDKPMAVEFKKSMLDTGGAGRVNTKIGHLSELFRWAVGNGEAGGAEVNPFDGIRISKKSKLAQKVQSFQPFTETELAAIFNPAKYPDYGYKAHFHWLPLLLCYTGARPDEIASLRLEQLREEQGIDFIALKAAKNSNSIRKIPLHSVVRQSGFMAYLANRRAEEPDGQLFPLLKPSKNGFAKNVARRFNESYLPALRIDDPTKRLYSFRATFITRMTELNVNTAMLMALVGHFEQDALDLSSPHFKNYQGAKRITALRDTIDMFDIKLPMVF